MKSILNDSTTLTFSANANNEQLAIAVDNRKTWLIKRIDLSTIDADLTIDELYIDGVAVGIAGQGDFPIDFETKYGDVVRAYNEIILEASEGTGTDTANVTVETEGQKENN